jgi:gamma-glutamylcyclotransferase (GGCT)/AIG2-like uncharacterized protein YtfP
MTDAPDYLFVYGTLRQGAQNQASKLPSTSADYRASGRARGQLYLVAHYPGFVPSEVEGDWVRGDVYHLRSPELTYPELDKFEGCSHFDPLPHEYRRSVVSVLLDTGAWIEACAYVYARGTGGMQRIRSGDYFAR